MAYKEDSGWNDALELKCLRIFKQARESGQQGTTIALAKELAATLDKPSWESINAKVGNYASVADGRPSHASTETKEIHRNFGDWPIPALDDLIKETEANGNTLPQTLKAQGDSRPHPDTSEGLQADLDELKSIPDETTRQRLVDARIGQGKFRAELLSDFHGECPITGIRIKAALAASHIKPWRACNNQERLDPNNGLLLAVHIHALFDQGYISFDEDGILIVSAELPERECWRFGVPTNDAALIEDEERHRYLQYHRAHIFKHPQQ